MTHPSELWEDVASAALMGTARRPFTSPTTDSENQLGQVLAQIDAADPERALLSAAAVLALHRRAGCALDTTDLPLPAPSDLDDLPRVSQRAAKHLASILNDNKLQVFLKEWLSLTIEAGRRAPEELLPNLLNACLKLDLLRNMILRVIGQRGLWLAAQNPAWQSIDPNAADWPTLTLNERRFVLKNLRESDPAYARQLIESTWGADKAAARADVIQYLETGLSMADEPFLEAALDDKAVDVRKRAAYLLSLLPESRLVGRMQTRLDALVKPVKMNVLQNALSGAKFGLQVLLPVYTDELGRDGVEQHSSEKGIEKGAFWLSQIIAAVPLSWWINTWETTPSRLITLAAKTEWDKALRKGWKMAAQRQKDTDWAMALLEGEDEARDMKPYIEILSPQQREQVVMRLLQTDKTPFMQHPVRVILEKCDHQWSASLSRMVIEKVLSDVTNGYNQNFHYASSDLASYIPHFPLSMTDEIIQRIVDTSKNVTLYGHEEFLRLLRFRKSLYEEFNR